MSDIWDEDELAAALLDMGSTVLEADDGSGNAWEAADGLFDLGDALRDGLAVEEVRDARLADEADGAAYFAGEFDEEW